MMRAMQMFSIVNPYLLRKMISIASQEVILFSPGIDDETADALNEAARRLGPEKVHVILDISEKVCRFGYGSVEAIQRLQGALTLRESPGLRIAGVLTDGDGWLFTPTPLLIEAGKSDERQPNAVRISREQFLLLRQAILGEDRMRKESDLSNRRADVAEILGKSGAPLPEQSTPEIGRLPPAPEKIQKVAEGLKVNPPQKFDLARKVNVFNSQLEYVELTLQGCRFSSMKIHLPSEFLIGDAEEYLNRNLLSVFNLTGKNSDIIPVAFMQEFESFRKRYLKVVPHLGTVMLKSKKNAFLQELQQFEKKLDQIRKDLETRWDSFIEETKRKLADILAPRVRDKPPANLRNQIVEEKVSDQTARTYVSNGLNKVLPPFEEKAGDMKIICRFKAVTYETLNDSEFQREIEKQFPYIAWNQLYHEYDAVRGEELTNADDGVDGNGVPA